MFAVYKKEMQTYFKTPIGYVFIGMFLMISGFLFITYNLRIGYPSINYVLYSLVIVFMFLIPVLTMRLMSEEKNKKTDQLLLTSPVPVIAIVLGKFLAALTVYTIALASTVIYMAVISRHGNPAFAETFCSYIGFFLLGMAFISIGLFISSLTENQAVSAVSTFVAFLVLYLFGTLKSTVSSSFLATVLDFLAISKRFETFNIGVLSPAPCVYYTSLTMLFVFLTAQVTERRRWI